MLLKRTQSGLYLPERDYSPVRKKLNPDLWRYERYRKRRQNIRPMRAGVTVQGKFGPVSSFGNFNITGVTVGAGSGLCMVVMYGDIGGANPGNQVSGITWQGQGFQKLNGIGDASGNAVEIWFLLNPNVASSQPVAISSATGGNTDYAEVYVLTGVDQAVGVNNFTSNLPPGTPTSTSMNVSSAAGNLVLDIIASNFNALAGLTATQTGDWTINSISGGGSEAPGAASVSMGWSWTSGAGHVIQAGCNVIAAATGLVPGLTGAYQAVIG